MANTKLEIIKVATQFVMKKGFNAMSYADISKKLNVKNAAIHYHFPSKEDLGVAMMKQQQENVAKLIKQLNEHQTTEEEQLLALVEIYVDLNRSGMICPIGSMGSDILTLPKKVQKEVINDYDQVIEWLTTILENGRKKKKFRFDGNAKIKAFMIFNNLISGVLVARFTKVVPFKESIDQMMAELQNK